MVLATIGWEVRNAIALAPLALLVLEELPDSLGAVKSRDWGLPKKRCHAEEKVSGPRRKGVRNRFLIFGERFITLVAWEEPNVRLMVA